jgi:hypothetical protein
MCQSIIWHANCQYLNKSTVQHKISWQWSVGYITKIFLKLFYSFSISPRRKHIISKATAFFRNTTRKLLQKIIVVFTDKYLTYWYIYIYTRAYASYFWGSTPEEEEGSLKRSTECGEMLQKLKKFKSSKIVMWKLQWFINCRQTRKQ